MTPHPPTRPRHAAPADRPVFLSRLRQAWHALANRWRDRQRRRRDRTDLQDMSTQHLNDLGIGRGEIIALTEHPESRDQRRP